uniref:Uncharacterized protein n=1 Tax=Pseudomonas marincola TaxID=437900 RepID=A0A653DY53_9PSED
MQVSDWLFEIKKIRVHSHPSCVDGQVAGERYPFMPYLIGLGSSRSTPESWRNNPEGSMRTL